MDYVIPEEDGLFEENDENLTDINLYVALMKNRGKRKISAGFTINEVDFF